MVYNYRINKYSTLKVNLIMGSSQKSILEKPMKPKAFPPRKQKFQPGVNDLLTLYPEVAKEIVSCDPSTIMASSVKYQEWKCSLCGRIWSAPPRSRTKSYDPQPGCQMCKVKNTIIKRENNSILFKDAFPDKAKMAVDQNALKDLSLSSHKEIEWNCVRGHTYILSPNKIMNGINCPVCNFRQLDPTYNTIGAVRPDLVQFLVDKEMKNTVFANSKEKIQWMHTVDNIDHFWISDPYHMCYKYSGCHVCSGKTVQVGVNDFGQFLNNSDYKWSEENSINPEDITVGSNVKVILYCDKHPDNYVMKAGAKSFSSGHTVCQDCVPTGDRFRSKAEIEIYNMILEEFPFLVEGVSLENNVKRYRHAGISDIDILVQNHIAIDFNGEYWHLEGVFKPIGYHKDRAEKISTLGLAHCVVDETDWIADEKLERMKILNFVKQHISS